MKCYCGQVDRHHPRRGRGRHSGAWTPGSAQPLAQSTDVRDDRLRRARRARRADAAVPGRRARRAVAARLAARARRGRDRRRLVGRRDDPLHAGVHGRARTSSRRSSCRRCSRWSRSIAARRSSSASGRAPRFAFYLVPALVGAWLMGVPHPLHPTVHGAQADRSTRSARRCSGRSARCSAATSRATCASSTWRRCASRSGCPRARSRCSCSARPAFASGHDTFWIAVLALVTGFARARPLLLRPACARPRSPRRSPSSRSRSARSSSATSSSARRSPAGSGSASRSTSLVVALLPARPRDTVDVVPAPLRTRLA